MVTQTVQLTAVPGSGRPVTDTFEEGSLDRALEAAAPATPDSGRGLCICGDPETPWHGPFGCERPHGPDELCPCRAFIPADNLVCGICHERITSAWFTADDGAAAVHPNCYFTGATCPIDDTAEVMA